jgi:hypothetical protein
MRDSEARIVAPKPCVPEGINRRRAHHYP